MKKTIILLALLLPFLQGNAQKDSTAPYLKNPTLPAFKILLPDSAHWFTQANLKKGKAVMIMVFNPDCSHCQNQAEVIAQNHKELLSEIEIVMCSYQDLQKMRGFIDKYKLGEFSNIHVGRDVNYFFTPFYNMHLFPFLAIYDKKGKLYKVFEGGIEADKIKETFKGL
jgi:thiol-disulfide isomerase/thioredoxin